jgi:hypothetical protein
MLNPLEKVLGASLSAIEFPLLIAENWNRLIPLNTLIKERKDLLTLFGVSKETLNPDEHFSLRYARYEIERARYEIDGRVYFFFFPYPLHDCYLVHDGLNLEACFPEDYQDL